ncbi:MAG: CehA/McbA family metallohydrolase [Actinomycetota bacterium]
MRISRRRFLELAAGTGVALLPGMRLGPALALPPAGLWLAGDFHCHTVLSHDVWGGPGDDPQELYTLGWTAGEQIANAESRGLDFVAITDHDRVDALHLPEYTSSRLTLVPGYEHSLGGGHAGVFAPDKGLLTDIVRDADGSKSFDGDHGVTRFLQAVREREGMAVLNHPFYGNEDRGEAIAWGYGTEASLGFDAVEVWNINWLARHDVIPVADSDNYLSLEWLEREFVRRREAAAVGGSDNHWRSTTALQGVGQPTTWVFAGDRTPQAILDAVRAGRTFIASQPPALGGARLFLSVTEDWPNGVEAMPGDDVGAGGPLAVNVRVESGSGNILRIVSTGTMVAESPVVAPSSDHDFRVALPEGGWLRAELYLERGHWMTALTSPIYARGTAPAPARTKPTEGRRLAYGHPSARATYLPLLGPREPSS